MSVSISMKQQIQLRDKRNSNLLPRMDSQSYVDTMEDLHYENLNNFQKLNQIKSWRKLDQINVQSSLSTRHQPKLHLSSNLHKNSSIQKGTGYVNVDQSLEVNEAVLKNTSSAYSTLGVKDGNNDNNQQSQTNLLNAPKRQESSKLLSVKKEVSQTPKPAVKKEFDQQMQVMEEQNLLVKGNKPS